MSRAGEWDRAAICLALGGKKRSRACHFSCCDLSGLTGHKSSKHLTAAQHAFLFLTAAVIGSPEEGVGLLSLRSVRGVLAKGLGWGHPFLLTLVFCVKSLGLLMGSSPRSVVSERRSSAFYGLYVVTLDSWVRQPLHLLLRCSQSQPLAGTRLSYPTVPQRFPTRRLA